MHVAFWGSHTRARGTRRHVTRSCSLAAPPSPAVRLQVATQASLILLLFGNCVADYCLLADMGTLAVQDLYPGGTAPPRWVRLLTASDGRLVMTLLGIIVVFPLSCMRHLREVSKQ